MSSSSSYLSLGDMNHSLSLVERSDCPAEIVTNAFGSNQIDKVSTICEFHNAEHLRSNRFPCAFASKPCSFCSPPPWLLSNLRLFSIAFFFFKFKCKQSYNAYYTMNNSNSWPNSLKFIISYYWDWYFCTHFVYCWKMTCKNTQRSMCDPLSSEKGICL